MIRRTFIALLASIVILAGCGPAPLQPQTTPAKAPEVKPDGEYTAFMLPCKCGGVIAYVPASCTCFDAEFYPDLAAALDKTYKWLSENSGGQKTDKVIGKYETITLECGCSLGVFVPGSSKCLAAKCRELDAMLTEVYQLAQKYKEKTDSP